MGIKTEKPLENDLTWEKTQTLFAKLSLISGIILLVFTALTLICFSNFRIIDISIISVIVVTIQLIVFTIIAIFSAMQAAKPL
jgi:hypothetical protein